MNQYDAKLQQYIVDNHIAAEHLVFTQSCHTVEEAAKRVNATVSDLIKSVCLIGEHDQLIIAIVKGEDRVSFDQVGAALNIKRPRIATREEVLQKTGYPAGGTPAFGFEATFLIDPKVMEMEVVYAGGGSDHALTKISPQELQKANQGKVVSIRS